MKRVVVPATRAHPLPALATVEMPTRCSAPSHSHAHLKRFASSTACVCGGVESGGVVSPHFAIPFLIRREERKLLLLRLSSELSGAG
jgi:hypothetical protein